MDRAFPVVVIGAGLSGLTAALHLAARGVAPLVLEADTEFPGGRLAGGAADIFTFNGKLWSFDGQHGIHALWGGYDNMRAMLDRFIGIDLIPSEGEEWINRWRNQVRAIEAGTAVRNTWLPAPMHYLQLLLRPRFWGTITPLDFLSLPGMLVSLIWAMGLDPIDEQIDLDGLMIDEFFRGWTPNLRAIFTGLAHSMLAAPSEAITLTGFIAAMRFYTFNRRDGWRLDFLPSNPHDCLITPMMRRIEEFGGEVAGGMRALELRHDAAGWEILVEDAAHNITRSVRAEHVILAVQAPAAERLLKNSPATPEAAEMRFPRGLRNAAVRLWFDAEPRRGVPAGMFTGDFAVDNFFWLHRMQDEFKVWHEQTGGSAIEVHLYAPESILDRGDNVLLIETLKEVQVAFPTLRGHFVHGVVRHNSATQTAFLVPTARSLHVETPWPNFFACGDWIGYPSPAFWMERCTVTGIAAANHVLASLNEFPLYDLIPPRKPEALARMLGIIVKWGRGILGPVIFATVRALQRFRE